MLMGESAIEHSYLADSPLYERTQSLRLIEIDLTLAKDANTREEEVVADTGKTCNASTKLHMISRATELCYSSPSYAEFTLIRDNYNACGGEALPTSLQELMLEGLKSELIAAHQEAATYTDFSIHSNVFGEPQLIFAKHGSTPKETIQVRVR